MATYTPNFNLSKPEDTDTQSSFISEYCDNMDKIDQNLGGGGGGGGNVYGVYIDPSNIITSGSWNASLSYTATKDCFVLIDGDLQNSHLIVNIDGVKIYDLGSSTYIQQVQLYPLRKGQVLTATKTTNYDLTYTVFGVLEGSDGIFAPVIYSDTERKIGVWRDNKPLYQKTVSFNTASGGNSTTYNHGIADIDTIVDCFGVMVRADNVSVTINNSRWEGNAEDLVGCLAGRTTISLFINYNGYRNLPVYITIQYTKTTDSPGSGDWNVDGSPTYTAGEGIDITSKVISLEYLTVVNGAVNLVFDDGN